MGKTAPILDGTSADMHAVCESYIQHRDALAMAHDAIMNPLQPPSVTEELLLENPILDKVDPYFLEEDKINAIRIKKQRDAYYVDGACIHAITINHYAVLLVKGQRGRVIMIDCIEQCLSLCPAMEKLKAEPPKFWQHPRPC